MISISNFGWRLGNQLFQLATAIALAKENGDEVAFPEWDYAKHFSGDFTPKKGKVLFEYIQPGFHYEEIPYIKNMAINGYFQSSKFFEKHIQTINEMLSPKIEPSIVSKIDDLSLKYELCAMHIRRGDYLDYKNHHPTLQVDYYDKAIAWMRLHFLQQEQSKYKFLVFSDDISWCKNTFSKYTDMQFIEGNSDIEDFQMMTLCDHQIIANSSFSWWAAYLNWANYQDRCVIISPDTQTRWFGPALKHYNMNDLIPEGWIKL